MSVYVYLGPSNLSFLTVRANRSINVLCLVGIPLLAS